MDEQVESSTVNSGHTTTLKGIILTSMDNHALQIPHHQLNGTSYYEWFQHVMLVIGGKGKTRYLTRRIKKPLPTYADY